MKIVAQKKKVSSILSSQYLSQFCDECRWNYIASNDEVAGAIPACAISLAAQ
jgi:hypothetical protein